MPWADEEAAPATPPTTGGRWEDEPAPAPAPTGKWETAAEPAMPSAGEALAQGLGAGWRQVIESGRAIDEGKPPTAPTQESPAAAPLGWGDITSPISRGLPKLLYGLGESSPELAGGIAGGLAGAATPVPGGALVGGALGSGTAAAFKAIGPVFGEELKKSPQDPEGAWNRTLERAGTSGLFTGLGWAAFPLKYAQGPLKHLAFQAFGIQPGIAATGQVAQNVLQGKPTTENVGEAVARATVGTAIPMAGHAVLAGAAREAHSIAAQRANDPILSRLGEQQDGKGWLPSWNRIYTAIKDDLNPLREARNYLADGTQVPAAQDPYVLARLTRGSYGKAEHFIDHGAFDPETGQNIGMGLKQVLDPVKDDLDGFRKYMMARRAIELDGRGIETGIPIRDAHDTVQQNPQFAQPFKNWVNYQRNLLDYMVKSGVVGRDQAQLMMDANKDYTPFYRLMEDPETFFGGPGGGLKVRNPIKGISGSERQILDPIESTVKNTYTYISLADRNMALRALQDLAARSPRGSEIMQRVAPGVHPIEVSANETARALKQQGLATFPGDPNAFTIFRPNAFRPSPDEIAVYNNGKPQVYKVDPYLGSAVNGLDREQLGVLTKILSQPAKLLRAGATLSPEFIARNPVRDQFSAFVFSTLGRGYVPIYDFFKGLGSVVTKGEGYQNWLKSGGANSAMVSIDRNYVENLVRRMKDPTFMGTMRNVARSPLDVLRAASELMENATRVGENMRMLKRGATIPEAGFASREVTLDFQRIGSKMRAVNSIIAFFNAQAEGVDRAIRSIGEQPLGFAAKVGAAITLPSIYLWAANKDDPRMQEIPRWEKDLFWIVPTDNWQPVSAQEAKRVPAGYARQRPDGQWEINQGNIYRIPKPFELGVLFGSVPERILDAYYNKNPNAFKHVFDSLQQAFLPNFVPQVASPVIEQFSNRSLFTERPLVPQYLQNLMPQYQANPYTTDTAKAIGRAVAKIPGMNDSKLASPIILENYIRAWTGGLGKHALDLSDSVLRGLGVTPTKVAPTLTNADKTLIKAFSVRFPEAGANSIQDFYDEYSRRSSAKKTITYLRKTGAPEDAKDIARQNVLATAEGIHKALSTQLKMVRDTWNNNKMSADDKRRFIDMSYLQMIKIAQIGNEVFRKTQAQFDLKRNQ